MSTKKIKSLLILLASLIACSGIFGAYTYADDINKAPEPVKNLDVVFVIDDTVSMQQNDPKKLSGSAMRQAVDLIENGNIANSSVRVGIGMYAINMMPGAVMDLGSVTDKEKIKKFTESSVTQLGKGTDAAQGIKWAVDQMDAHKDPNHKQVIILVGDGENSYVVGGQDIRTDAQSQQQCNEAVARAKAAGYTIYTMAINPQSSKFSNYFKNIAEATGGEAFEPKEAKEVGDCIRKIFGIKGETVKLPKDVLVSRPQDIPEGTFEFNIQCIHDTPIAVTMTTPSGVELNKDSDKVLYNQESNYTNYKIIEPESGTWTIKFLSSVEQYITYSCIAHTDINIKLESTSPEIRAKEPSNYKVSVYNKDELIDSNDTVKNLVCKLFLEDTATGEISENDMAINGSLFEGSVTIPRKGSYNIKAVLSGNEFSTESNTIAINVDKNSTAYTAKIAGISGIAILLALILLFLIIFKLIRKSAANIAVRIGFSRITVSKDGLGKRDFLINSDELASSIFRNKKMGSFEEVVSYFVDTYINIYGDKSINEYVGMDELNACRSIKFKGTKEKKCYITIPPSTGSGNMAYDIVLDNIKLSRKKIIDFKNDSKQSKKICIIMQKKAPEEKIEFVFELSSARGGINML